MVITELTTAPIGRIRELSKGQRGSKRALEMFSIHMHDTDAMVSWR